MPKQPGPELFGYICLFRSKRTEIYAKSVLAAKQEAIIEFKATRKQEHEVSVHLCERPDGSAVVHVAVD